VLLVANHPNSLLDPMVVQAAARRQVRFLAKAPLWDDPKTAWLMRFGRAIPVYRASDDPTKLARNAAMFEAVHAALAVGDAVGLFPEGISHSEPSIAPLKTGAARIALGAAAHIGGAFPIVPVGLVFRERDVFRSEALALVGAPVAWDDLARCGEGDADAVRELTQRIDAAIRQSTINLAQWEDAPLVECAMETWEAEQRAEPEPAARIARLAEATRILAAVRAAPDAETALVLRDVAMHQRRLARLRLRPADLVADVSTARGVNWALRRLPLLLPLWALAAGAGWLLFVVPYRVTGVVVDRFTLERDTRSTWKLLLGGAIYLVWVMGLAITVGLWLGAGSGVLTLVLVPVIGMLGLLVRERWRGAWADVQRWGLLRSRRRLMDTLRTSQHQLGQRLDQLFQHHTPRGDA
jgi:1-acyl-sn-glycerol-3-phosphate acyltransferase